MIGISPEYKSTALTNNTTKLPFLNRRNIHILQLYHLKNSNTYILTESIYFMPSDEDDK